MTLADSLLIEKNKLSTTLPWLVMLVVSLHGGTTLRIVNNTDDVEFDGETYTAFPFFLDYYNVQSNKGEIPVLQLKVSNVTRVFQAYVEDIVAEIDNSVLIKVVNYGYLEESFADLELTFDITAIVCDNQWITFTLSVPNPMRRRFPLDRYIPNYCRFLGNFKGAECKYTGADTTCRGTLADCRSKGNSANYGGFYGISRKGVKVV